MCGIVYEKDYVEVLDRHLLNFIRDWKIYMADNPGENFGENLDWVDAFCRDVEHRIMVLGDCPQYASVLKSSEPRFEEFGKWLEFEPIDGRKDDPAAP